MSRRQLRCGLLLVAVLGMAGLMGCGGSSGREATLSVQAPSGESHPDVSVEEVSDANASELEPGSESLSPVYSVEANASLAGPAQLRFELPDDLDGSEQQRLAVAYREGPDEMWLLAQGSVEDGDFVIKRREFSQFQLRLLGEEVDISVPSLRDIEEDILGVRASPPTCESPPDDLHLDLQFARPNDPLVAACLDEFDSMPEARVSNNRALALELNLTSGIELREASSPSLTEAFWHQTNRLLPGDTVIFPGAGSGAIVFDEPLSASLRTSNQAALTDLLIAVVSRGKAKTAEREAAKVAAMASCAFTAAHAAEVSFTVVRNLYADCGSFIGGTPLAADASLLLGNVGVSYGAFDALRTPLGDGVTLTVSQKQDDDAGTSGSCSRTSSNGIGIQVLETTLPCARANAFAVGLVECLSTGANLSSCTQQPYSGFACKSGAATGYTSGATRYDCDTPYGTVNLVTET